TMPYTQGRALGGGSVVNGIGANRGAPGDYDEWEALGAKGWTWENVLPFFLKLERDLEMAGPLHGQDGPIPVRRVPKADRSGFVEALVAALARQGVPEKPDQNGAWEDGVFPLTANCDETWTRVPTSVGYLTPSVRARPNLTILTETKAISLILEGKAVVGARVRDADGEQVIRASETIVACGALQTPTMLMRSGIGPAGELAARGIKVICDSPGVGRNLMEHPSAAVAAFLPRSARLPAREPRHHIPAIWRFSSGLPGEPDGDMHMAMVGRGSWHAMGRRMGLGYVWVNRSHGRGLVRLGADPFGPPEVDLRLLSDERDRVRLREAFKRVADLMADVHAQGLTGAPFAARLSDRARRFGAPSLRNETLMTLAGAAVDLSGPFAPKLFEAMVAPEAPLAALLADDAVLDAYLDRVVTGVWHASGTCRMGADLDRLAVTDEAGLVRGVTGLRVCDASLFPSIPSANINLPVIMVAERIASLIEASTAHP
ncbi:MAG: GMC family oxidoreductase N-terminal domain-containing protein, partial [Alphaproteobacteria bacterium]